MILLVILFVVLIGYLITRFDTDITDFIGWSTVGVFGLLFLFFFLWFVSARFDTATYLERREALQKTYEQSRELNQFERATITKDIAEFNKGLAVDKYWNDTWLFDWFVNDVVEQVEPIK